MNEDDGTSQASGGGSLDNILTTKGFAQRSSRASDSENLKHHTHRKHSSHRSSSASRQSAVQADSQLLDSVLSVLENTLEYSNNDLQRGGKRHHRRSASAMPSTLLQSGGYFVNEYGDLQQSSIQFSKSEHARSHSASRANLRKRSSADQLRLSVPFEDDGRKQKPASLVPSVALKGVNNQCPKFTNFLRAHHAVPSNLHYYKSTQQSQSQTLKPGPIATGGVASPPDIKQLLFRDNPLNAQSQNVISQRSVLSVSAEHKEPLDQPGSIRCVVKPIARNTAKQRPRPVKPIPLAQIYNKPIKNTDSTLQSVNSSAFFAQTSRSSSTIHDQSFNTEEQTNEQSVQPLDVGKHSLKGLKLLKPVRQTTDKLSTSTQPVALTDQCIRSHTENSLVDTTKESVSDASFVDVNVQIAEPILLTEAPRLRNATTRASTSEVLDSPQNEVILLKPRLAVPVPPLATNEKGGVRHESTSFQTMILAHKADEQSTAQLREEFIVLGARLAKLANRRAYVESAFGTLEHFATAGNADHTYLGSEMDVEQQKLDLIEEEMTKILSRRTELRQYFIEAGVDLQMDLIDERKARKNRIDQALLLELNSLNGRQNLENSVFSATLSSTWADQHQMANSDEFHDKGPDLSLHDDMIASVRPLLPMKEVPAGMTVHTKVSEDILTVGISARSEDIRSESAEVGLQVTGAIIVAPTSIDSIMEHLSQVLDAQYTDRERIILTALLMAFEDPTSVATYTRKNLLLYIDAIRTLDNHDSTAAIEVILPIYAKPYSHQIVALLKGFSFLLSTQQSSLLMSAILGVESTLELVLSAVPKLLSSIIDLMRIFIIEQPTTPNNLAFLHYKAAKSSCVWLASKLLLLVRHGVHEQDKGMSLEVLYYAIRPAVGLISTVSPDIYQKWQAELNIIVSSAPQLLHYKDVQEILQQR